MPSRLRKRSLLLLSSPMGAGRRRRMWVKLIAAFATVLGVSRMLPKRLVVLNLSPSLPLGLYYAVRDEPGVGRLVEFRSQRETLNAEPGQHERYILKPIFAIPGDRVDTTGDWLWINGQRIAPIHTTDSNGHPLPVWRANRVLEPDEFFVFSARVPNSFDSRYYGPVRHRDIIAVRKPLWTWGRRADTNAAGVEPASAYEGP
jgi:conjugative transfer signal peptidase TraF